MTELITPQEFWEKWIVKEYGGHVPVKLLQKKDKFFEDLKRYYNYEWEEDHYHGT